MNTFDKLLFRDWDLSLLVPVKFSFSEISKYILRLVSSLVVRNIDLFIHLLERYIILLVVDAANVDSVTTVTSLLSGIRLQDGILLLSG